ncbi:hypothetical protein MtrunA17_Chr7g0239161 [Medicago truncatula]|uniref:Uncharacterized protein n=1 Tax=Medicago truncatula TaxID=3880 RepID=A0A396H5E2_MEDTR|nr:hypothetical protein MtrunA17_Chr7g0239161 [Medicago truncatula]
MKKFVGNMVAVLMHLEFYSLTRRDLNIKCILQYHEDTMTFISDLKALKFLSESSARIIKDAFRTMWLKNWQNPNACSINLVLSIGFIILATSNGKQKPCYMLQNGSDSHISTILKLHCCEALPISIGITPDQPACAEVQSVGSIADVALNFNMLVKNYGLVMLGNKILCIVDKFDHDGYMDVAERVIQIYVKWSNICAAAPFN